MMKFSWILVLAALATAPAANAGAPFLDLKSPSRGISNLKAAEVGDIVTILIDESASANSAAKTDLKSKTEASGGPGLGMLNLVKPWGLDTESKFQGDGKSSRSGDLNARISTRIVEILPNGNFRLRGDRIVEINGEKQTIRISGVVRSRDILSNNSIRSTYVADAHISYDGSGEISDARSPGLFTRLINFLF